MTSEERDYVEKALKMIKTHLAELRMDTPRENYLLDQLVANWEHADDIIRKELGIPGETKAS